MHRLHKKFLGWIFPEKVAFDHQHHHGNHHARFLGAVVGLRHRNGILKQIQNDKKKYFERFVYVGCVHGGNEQIYKRLKTIMYDPPDYLVFTGDLTGSSEIERLKRKFYDTKEKNPKSEFASYEYFGDWAKTLSVSKRKELVGTLQPSAETLVHVLQKIRKKGTRIILLEGNWDNPITSGVKVIAGSDIPEFFKTKIFFTHNGFRFIDAVKILETKTTLHLFFPYISLLHFDFISKRKLKEMKRELQEAKYEGKTIIMVAHAEANWKMHHLWQKNPKAHGQRAQVIRNFGRAMALFCPDEVIYPHQHARIRDETGKLLSPDAKYLLHVVNGYVRLVEDPVSHVDDDCDIVATYIPFGLTAEEKFMSA